MDFLALASACAPSIHPVTLTAVVRIESFYDPLVVRDNTLHVTFYPRTRQVASELLERAQADNHQVAVGLMQVTSAWAAQLHIRTQTLLDPCTNLAIGAQILVQDYLLCAGHDGGPAQQLSCALSLYWSGTETKGGAYVNRVYRAAGSSVRVPETPGITDGILGTPAMHFPELTHLSYNDQVLFHDEDAAQSFEPATR